jgi:hypothetical protein
MNIFHEELIKKWSPVLDTEGLAPITDSHKKLTTAILLENMETELGKVPSRQFLTEDPIPTNFMGASSSTHGTGGIDTFDPVLVSLVRRAMPQLLPFDIAGVQPMTAPTGLVFALRSRYTNQSGAEAFYSEANTQFSSVTSGANTFGQKHVGTLPAANGAANGTYNTGTAMSTAQAEALGTDSNTAYPEMAFTIERVAVEAKSRALKAGYTHELAQDLKAVHGLNAEDELANILQTEIIAEINREFLRTLNFTAKVGSTTDTTTSGTFDLDVDSNGRWSNEKFRGLLFHMDREANRIMEDTRRGKGNIIIASADVVSALNATDMLSLPNNAIDLNSNFMTSTFAGVLKGGFKVYIDPYAAGGNYFTMGYKGPGSFDAGIFYCPYVPLQLMRAVHPSDFSPRIGFKTRYGMVSNPFAEGLTQGLGAINKDSNVYYRKTLVTHIL